MSPEDRSLRRLMIETYAFSQSNIRRLKSRLDPDHVESLASEVIRRLSVKENDLTDVPLQPSREWLHDFCTALISNDDKAAAKMVATLQADGVSANDVYLKHVAAAARLLGDWWTDDKASFAEVTVGTARLLAIMRSMRFLFVPKKTAFEKSAIFASVPGETHTLGVHMATDLLRKEGWDISLKTGLDHDELVAEIEASPSNIVGLSLSGEHSIKALTRLVVALHICRPEVPIIVSGSKINTYEPLIKLMGVDGIATDVEDAKAQMTALLTSGPRLQGQA